MGGLVLGTREELVHELASEMLASQPDLLSEEVRPMLEAYLLWKCKAFILDADNARRIEVANRLIRKRDMGVPWNPAEQEQATFYGVRG